MQMLAQDFGEIGVLQRERAIESVPGRELIASICLRIASETGRMKGFEDLTIIRWKSQVRIQARGRVFGF